MRQKLPSCFFPIYMIIIASLIINIGLYRSFWRQTFYKFKNIYSLSENSLSSKLHKLADEENRIFIIYVDLGFINMALNLHFFLKNLAITNYIFLCANDLAATILEKEGINFYLIENDPTGNHSSLYGTNEYRRKTLLKNRFVFTVLQQGFNTFLLDADIVLFRSPLDFLTCPSCDIQFQCESGKSLTECRSYSINTGCYYAKSSRETIKIFSHLQKQGHQNFGISEQKLMVQLLKAQAKSKLLSAKFGYFEVALFANGATFFSGGNRQFFGEDPCLNCVLVHNNFIRSLGSKIYRFKELQLWFVNTDEYYTSNTTKYLLYENPYTFLISQSQQTILMEKHALFSALALGKLLHRVVILPRFHCKRPPSKGLTKNCSLLSLLPGQDMINFDQKFSNLYRESVFLKHPWVHKSVRDSISRIILIKSKITMEKITENELRNISHQFTPMDTLRGATGKEIQKWFNHTFRFYKVLNFHSLYNAIQI